LKICSLIFKVFIKGTLIMVKYIPRSAALLALASGARSSRALAQDSGALLDALVQEGVIKESKAEAIRKYAP